MKLTGNLARLMALLAVPAAAQTFSVLYSFTGGSDGSRPQAGLIVDGSGAHVYGVTGSTLFEIDADGTFHLRYTFTIPIGGPNGYIVRDGQGNFYGTSPYGGDAYEGSVWKESQNHATLLHAFTGGIGGTDAAIPMAGLARDSAGNLYGVTDTSSFPDIVFKVDATGSFSILQTFSAAAGPLQNIYPSRLILDSAGNLYGTSVEGGLFRAGAVFRLSPAGKLAVLFSFGAGVDGWGPYQGLVRDSAGNLYGVTAYGGKDNYGTIFKVSSIGRMDVLYNMTQSDGASNGDLIRDPAGNLYGTTMWGGRYGAGSVYKLDPAGNMTVLHHFTGGVDGANPRGGVNADGVGNLYGTTDGGGLGHGVVFKIAP
jgi:uncharacterized repeat protein (TIGR03803 family)